MSENITPISPKIVIDEIGPKKEIEEVIGAGNQLFNCYFLLTEIDGAYHVFSPDNKLLAAYVVSGEDFNFTVDGVHFEIKKFKIDDVASCGHWKNNVPSFTEEQEGTFQAQAGGAGEGESVSAASA